MAEIALAGATSVLRQTVGVLGNLIVDESSHLSRLREGILWIESEFGYIQSYLEDADAKQRQNRKITRLVIDIRDLAYDVENIMDTYFSRITSHRRKGIFSRLKSAFCVLRYTYDVHNFIVEVEGIKRRVENINRLRLTYGINEGNSATRVRRVTAYKSSLFEDISSNSQHVNLRTVLYFNDEDERVKISQDLRLLRVLYLDKIILSRPNDIGNFCHLTYLQLRSNDLGKLPSAICNLKSLLTLDVRGYGFDIPIGIWKMRQLRHLILSFFTNDKVQQIDVSLPNLQSMHLKPIQITRFVEVLRLKNLTSLRKLWITSQSVNRSRPLSTLNLPRCENLHKLYLGVSMKNLPDLDKLPNLTKLVLEFSESVESPLETLKKLPKLKILKLGEKSYNGRQIICSGGPDNFPQLETLEIHDLIWLQELIVEEGAMPRLKKLSIFGCGRLTGIPDRFRNITTITAE
ncbi:hypothetical protein Acr_11g0006510 [Actinidia rufa]|uniref:Rx N-terminal domain-containing protein n=1 Tax=Actinidia rufa TaxID=165716 RepID=A0A7J0FCE1_9ERIC|nr:hypothetical protein Acr_11g0006510 [Actinidia rufa]